VSELPSRRDSPSETAGNSPTAAGSHSPTYSASVTGIGWFIVSYSQQLRGIDSPDLVAWGGLASASSDGIIASSTIGISAVCLFALVVVVAFLLKRKGSRDSHEGYEMDHEREELRECVSDAVDLRECEVITVNDVQSVGWSKGAIVSEEEGFLSRP
jgi:hypothetical protein